MAPCSSNFNFNFRASSSNLCLVWAGKLTLKLTVVIVVVSRQMAVQERMQSTTPIPQLSLYFTSPPSSTTTTKMSKVRFFGQKQLKIQFQFVILVTITYRSCGQSIGETIARASSHLSLPTLSFVYTRTEKSSPISIGESFHIYNLSSFETLESKSSRNNLATCPYLVR